MSLPKTNFKPSALRITTLVVVSVGIVSCGGGGETDSAPMQPANSVQASGANQPNGEQVSTLADGSWKLGDIIFITDFNRGTVQNNRSDNVLIVVADTIFDTSNGNYSGSALRVTLSSTGSGNYTVTDSSSAQSAFGSGAKVASIAVIAGTTSQNATQWVSTTTSGTLSVNVNSDGRYFVSTTEPIIVTAQREFDSGTGVVGSPDQISFEMRNINAD